MGCRQSRHLCINLCESEVKEIWSQRDSVVPEQHRIFKLHLNSTYRYGCRYSLLCSSAFTRLLLNKATVLNHTIVQIHKRLNTINKYNKYHLLLKCILCKFIRHKDTHAIKIRAHHSPHHPYPSFTEVLHKQQFLFLASGDNEIG